MNKGLIDGGDQLEQCLKEELERERRRKLAREVEIELAEKYSKSKKKQEPNQKSTVEPDDN